jgi:hypothetical protein
VWAKGELNCRRHPGKKSPTGPQNNTKPAALPRKEVVARRIHTYLCRTGEIAKIVVNEFRHFLLKKIEKSIIIHFEEMFLFPPSK